MNWRTFWKATVLLTLSIVLVVGLILADLIAFTVVNYFATDNGDVSSLEVSQGLRETDGAYTCTADVAAALRANAHWAILIDNSGNVVWQLDAPADVPTHYELRDVASFSRWYLGDYPVTTRIRDDGILVIGQPAGSMWKHDVTFSSEALSLLPVWTVASLLLILAAILGLSALLLRHWFRSEQKHRDTARAEWINGISHDIRTPLSLVMGNASQLETNPALDESTHRQAAIIRRQSQTIRDLIGDLNLTMRLDCAMEPLRRETLAPTALLRQTVADFLNSGLADDYPLTMDLPDAPLPALNADARLLHRAITNLLNNCVHHNAPGTTILVGARTQSRRLQIFVESIPAAGQTAAPAPPPPVTDGGAPHGTGLKLVAQIARAHGGQARFITQPHFRCEINLPLREK